MLPCNILTPLAHYSHWEYPGSKIVEILPSTIFKVKCEFIASQSYQRKQHNDIKKKVYSCKKCEITTSIPGYLKVHKETHLTQHTETFCNMTIVVLRLRREIWRFTCWTNMTNLNRINVTNVILSPTRPKSGKNIQKLMNVIIHSVINVPTLENIIQIFLCTRKKYMMGPDIPVIYVIILHFELDT